VLSSRTLVRNLRIDSRELSGAALGAEGDRALARDIAEAHLAALAREIGGIALSNLDKTALALEVDVRAVSAARVMPIGDLYRSTVIELARLRNTISPVISRGAQNAYEVPDVDGLEECGTSDEERLAYVDHVLSSYVEWERSASDIVTDHGHPEVVEEIIRRTCDHELARAGRGICIMASSKTIYDTRNPIGMVWHDRPRKEDERADAESRDSIILPGTEGMRGVRYEPQSRRIRDVREMARVPARLLAWWRPAPRGLWGRAPRREGRRQGERAGSRVDQPLLGELVLSKCSPSYAILEAILELTFVFLGRCTWRGRARDHSRH